MKKILPFLLLISIYSFGQGVNYEKGFNSDYNQTVAGVSVFEEFSFIAENVNHANSFFSDAYISKIDTLGSEIWKIKALSSSNKEVTKINSIVSTSQGGVLINGSGMGCCDCGFFYCFTEEYDANGLLLWSEIHNGNTGSVTSLYENDSNIVFSSFNNSQNTKVYFINSSSNLDSLELLATSILGLSQSNNASFLARTVDSLFEYDFQGNEINTATFGNEITGLEKITNDSIVVLTTDSVFVLNANFQQLYSESFTGYNTYNDLKILNGEVYFTASTQQIRWLIKLDNFLQIESNLALSYDGDFSEVELDYSLSHISIITDFNLSNYKSIRVLDYSLTRVTGNFTNDLDVKLCNVRINEASTLENTSEDSVYTVNLDVDVLVKNNSNTLISECRISCLLGNATCNERYFTELKSGLSIAPNDSVWIPLGWIGEGDYSMFQNQITYIKCFYTSNPNGVVDLNVSNDSYCKSGIAGYVSFEETENTNFSIYPNPVKDVLFIESESEIEEVSIYSINGKLIKSLYYTKSFDISNLENGVYIIKVKSGGSIINKQFIKSN